MKTTLARKRIALIPFLLATLAAGACVESEDNASTRSSGGSNAESPGSTSSALSVVTNGAFTNVYVYPNSSTQTWDEHMKQLRPDVALQFSRASIDAVTDRMMAPGWPSYFDSLYQYSGVHPAQFFGSAVASEACVQAAMNDLHDGVLQWDTIRSLSNCHDDGMDPSPQVNLIFSPEIRIAKIPPYAVGTMPDMCATSTTNAWHAWGVNVPNFSALPTSDECNRTFASFTQALSHEDVEILSDPAGAGFGTAGEDEVGDRCENVDRATLRGNDSLSRYWSVSDKDCEPRLDAPNGDTSTTWILGQGSPLQRFSGSASRFLPVPADSVVTDAAVTQLSIVLQTGSDDLRGDSSADVTLTFKDGSPPVTTSDVSVGRHYDNGETNSIVLDLPTRPIRVRDIAGVTISTNFTNGDNWNIDKVALVASYALGSATTPPQPLVSSWLDASGAPLVRFTGNTHDLRIVVPSSDMGIPINALNLVISTGNDDLRGGSHAQDNCDVGVELASGQILSFPNVNHGQSWAGWTKNTVAIPLPAGLNGGDVKAITLHTGFGGGIGGDNWNVERVQLLATLPPPVVNRMSPDRGARDGGTPIVIDGSGFDRFGGTRVFFGATPATEVVCPTTNECVVKSPPGSGAVPVTAVVNGVTYGTVETFSYVPSVTGLSQSTGTLNDPITIQGVGLGGGSVTFGDSIAPDMKCSDTACVGTVPPGAGTVDVRVTVNGATTWKSPTDRFSYAEPVITGVSPASGAVTGGSRVTITGKGFDPYSKNIQVYFGGIASPYVTCSPTSCDVTTPPGTTTGPVSIQASVFGVMTPLSSADVFTYTQYPRLTGLYWANNTGAYLTLDGNPPAGGAEITLTSSDPSVVLPPATVTVPVGYQQAGFRIAYLATTRTGTAMITASYQGSSVSTPFAFSPATVTGPTPLVAVTLGPYPSLAAGSWITGAVTLPTPAPAGGVVVALSSSMPAAIAVPATVVVPAGSEQALFTFTNLYSGAPQDVTVTATYGGATATSSIWVPTAPATAADPSCKQIKCPLHKYWNADDCMCESGSPR